MSLIWLILQSLPPCASRHNRKGINAPRATRSWNRRSWCPSGCWWCFAHTFVALCWSNINHCVELNSCVLSESGQNASRHGSCVSLKPRRDVLCACRSLFVCCKALVGASWSPGLTDCVDSRKILELACLGKSTAKDRVLLLMLTYYLFLLLVNSLCAISASFCF